MSPDDIPLHNNIRQFREELGWSQQELTERIQQGQRPDQEQTVTQPPINQGDKPQ
jgi:ribosome-binding protein aMBF1 (putative translation factor)